MNDNKSLNLSQIIKYLEDNKYLVDIIGEKNCIIDGFSSANKYKRNSLTWIKDDANAKKIVNELDVCIAPIGVMPKAKTVLICNNVKAAFFATLEHFFYKKPDSNTVGENTVIGNQVQIDDDVVIGNNCSIIGEITIGSGTVISDNVVIKNRVSIGSNCEIQALTVIGEDGFAYSEDANHKKDMIKHYGGVTIGNNVFVGSHVNIARGTIDDTVIEDGVKISPSSHIGHNNYIEKDSTIICSQLYGSAHMGENSYIVASVLKNQTQIGNNTMIGMGSVVVKSIEDNKVAYGIPAAVKKDRM